MNLISLLKRLNEGREDFTKERQDEINEHFFDYVHPDTGDEIPVYLSNYKEKDHIKKRFKERVSDPEFSWYNKRTSKRTELRDYMKINHPKGKFVDLDWPYDFERLLEEGIDEIYNLYNLRKGVYSLEYPYYGMIIKARINFFNESTRSDPKIFITVNTILSTLMSYTRDEDGRRREEVIEVVVEGKII